MTKLDSDARAKLEDLLQTMAVGVLVTRHVGGSMHGRPMAAKFVSSEGEIWFLTDIRSEKIDDIEKVEDVVVAFADPQRQVFVSVSGKATVTRERDLLHRHWMEAERIWFPDGAEDENLAAIRVAITHAEYWDAHGRTLGLAADYAKALVTGIPSDSEPDFGAVTYR